MVSREEIDGERDLKEVGVPGKEELEEKECEWLSRGECGEAGVSDGYASLYFAELRLGEDVLV
jgi:hypothetical protein